MSDDDDTKEFEETLYQWWKYDLLEEYKEGAEEAEENARRARINAQRYDEDGDLLMSYEESPADRYRKHQERLEQKRLKRDPHYRERKRQERLEQERLERDPHYREQKRLEEERLEEEGWRERWAREGERWVLKRLEQKQRNNWHDPAEIDQLRVLAKRLERERLEREQFVLKRLGDSAGRLRCDWVAEIDELRELAKHSWSPSPAEIDQLRMLAKHLEQERLEILAEWLRIQVTEFKKEVARRDEEIEVLRNQLIENRGERERRLLEEVEAYQIENTMIERTAEDREAKLDEEIATLRKKLSEYQERERKMQELLKN